MELKELRDVTDDMHHAILELKNMGFSEDTFDGVGEATEAIKRAAEDVKQFRKFAFFSVLGTGILINTLAAYFIFNFVVDYKLTKIDNVREAVELLYKLGIDLHVTQKINPNTGHPIVGVHTKAQIIVNDVGDTFYLIPKL